MKDKNYGPGARAMANKEEDKPVTCKNCGGSGTVIVKVGNKTQATTCGVCKGAGVV